MPYWDERVEAMAVHYPDVSWDKYHIDILTAHFVQHPDWFDVVVASNLFGDILSDLGPACTGTIGIAPSGNINHDRTFPSLVERSAEHKSELQSLMSNPYLVFCLKKNNITNLIVIIQ